MKISFIGGGNMGEAMLSKILDCGLAAPWEITVGEPGEDRRKYLGEKYEVEAFADNRVAAKDADVVVFSVKPQYVDGPLADLSEKLKPSQLVISIMAGVPISKLRSGLKHDRIVRVMPNTPAQIGEGMSVWTASPEVTKRQKGWASSILNSVGKEIHVDDEEFINMATAIHGSGPAYFFLLIESLIEAGSQIGLPRDMAQTLAVQTMLGSGHLIEQSGKSPAELRQMVTSKGGTTAAALAEFEKGEFPDVIIKAVKAAYARARELGRESG